MIVWVYMYIINVVSVEIEGIIITQGGLNNYMYNTTQ
jgi:hypothetical protein